MSGKKVPKVRVNFEAPAPEYEEWKAEAEQSKMNFSEFARRACARYAMFRKKKRTTKNKGD